MRWLRSLIGWSFLLAVLGLTGWLGYINYSNSGDDSEFRFDKATRGNLAVFVEATGSLQPEETIDVGAQVAGRVLFFGKDLTDPEKPITFGSKVKQGTLLAQLDDRLFETRLRVAKAAVEKAKADVRSMEAKQTQAERDWRRIQEVRGSGAVTQQETDTARAVLETTQADLLRARASIGETEANLAEAQINLEYTKITSPVDGVIIDRRVNVGQTVVASLNAPSLFLIAKDLTRLQIWVMVNEADIGSVSVGQEAQFKVDVEALKAETFQGTVAQIRLNAAMQQNVVTYTVVVDAANPDMKLKPYLTANVRFLVNQRADALLVPNAALRYKPAPAKVDLEYRAAYEATVSKTKDGATAGKSSEASKGGAPKGARKPVLVDNVWAVSEDGDLVPIKLRLGISDGKRTEVLEVLDGTLSDTTELVVGEVPIKKALTVNPFAPPPIFKRGK